MIIKPVATPDRTASIRLLIRRWEEKNGKKKPVMHGKLLMKRAHKKSGETSSG